MLQHTNKHCFPVFHVLYLFHSLLQIKWHFTCHCIDTMPCSSARYGRDSHLLRLNCVFYTFWISLFGWSQAIKCQGLDLDSLLPDQEMLMKIMVHPLQIQVYHQWTDSHFDFTCTCLWPCVYENVVLSAGMSVRDPQQHVGQEWSADQRTGYDLRAVTLLQLHDWPWHLSAPGWGYALCYALWFWHTG